LLRLGEQIVSELEKRQSVDMLGAWMAHYVAELIHAAGTAEGEDQPVKLKQCADAILAIWEHRHRLPDRMRPFEDFEAIFSSLQNLDPYDSRPRYFRHARLAAIEVEPEPGTATWLKFADSVDYSARILIRYALAEAAKSAGDRSVNWVALAEAAGVDHGFEFPVIRIIIGDGDQPEACDPEDEARKEIEGRIKRLEAFEKMIAIVATDLRARLRRVEASSEPGKSGPAEGAGTE
jgi:hypothetical protein